MRILSIISFLLFSSLTYSQEVMITDSIYHHVYTEDESHEPKQYNILTDNKCGSWKKYWIDLATMDVPDAFEVFSGNSSLSTFPFGSDCELNPNYYCRVGFVFVSESSQEDELSDPNDFTLQSYGSSGGHGRIEIETYDSILWLTAAPNPDKGTVFWINTYEVDEIPYTRQTVYDTVFIDVYEPTETYSDTLFSECIDYVTFYVQSLITPEQVEFDIEKEKSERNETTSNVFIPNAFSPNGDGINDTFYFETNAEMKVHVFEVYDRWGGLCYTGKLPWNGGDYSNGIYLYHFLLEDENSFYMLSGEVTIIK